MSIHISWPTDKGVKEVAVTLPVGGIDALRKQVAQHLGNDLQNKNFMLTDTLKDITNDEDVARIRDGTTLVVTNKQDGSLSAPARERITFQPHPKTLTMAGDYEYFAAQGRHPFVYALAEFVDNSLRATRKNAPKPREITISILTSGTGASRKGLICISDNGCGMSKHELNDWAVMNYSMEERGNAPQEPDAGTRGASTGAGRFLSGDLSFFGVGSKNAAFFMGSSVKIATRKTGERYIHELSLAAADLEARYRNNEAVYEEDMVHRNPGDVSTLSRMELPFRASHDWVAAECSAPDDAFTRVIIGDLKPDILDQLCDVSEGQHICRELAHLYHYYLHGEHGNRNPSSAPTAAAQDATTHNGSHLHQARNKTLPNGEPVPHIVLRHATDSKLLWERALLDIDDDMETLILRGQKAEFTFTLQVADKGTVSGVLYYFPFENDKETMPIEGSSGSGAAAATAYTKLGAHAGVGLMGGPSQIIPGRTGNALNATQNPGAAVDHEDASDDENAANPNWRVPIFEAFWQGRLVPGARIESLPFIEALRQKRSFQAKDSIPDEVFRRVRGALFFGPAFRVTRNKLLFRDNLPDLLAIAVPGDRNMEKRFKEWAARCHATLDKSFRFEKLSDTRSQAALRARLGEGCTAFERITDGTRTVSVGDCVRINAKPALVGRVAYFTVPHAVRDEGAYANGRVFIEQLPMEVHGKGQGALKDFSVRRLETVLDDKAVQEYSMKEIRRLPTSLRIEPLLFAAGQAIPLAAGDAVPESSVAVVSACGQRLTRSFFNGERQSLVVTQRLWLLPFEGAPLPSVGEDDPGSEGHGARGKEEEEQQEEARPAKVSRKASRRGKKAPINNEDDIDMVEETPPNATAGKKKQPTTTAAPLNLAELIVAIENKTPCKDSFYFSKISDGLKQAGHYALEFTLSPGIIDQPALHVVVPITVSAAQPSSIKVVGEGVAALATREIILGERLPSFKIMLSDDYDNVVPFTASSSTSSSQTNIMGDVNLIVQAYHDPAPPSPPLHHPSSSAGAGAGKSVIADKNGDGTDPSSALTRKRCKGIAIAIEQESRPDCVALLHGIQVLGSRKAAAAAVGMPLFIQQQQHEGEEDGGQRSTSQMALQPATVHLAFSIQGRSDLEPEFLPITLRPGAPHSLSICPSPDAPWQCEDGVYSVASGEEIEPFTVQALDLWGNPTAPLANLPFTLTVACPSLTPSKSTFHFDSMGTATVTGLKSAVRMCGKALVSLSVECGDVESDAVKAAVEAAMPFKPLNLSLMVSPSTLPTFAQITSSGNPLPTKEDLGDDGSTVLTAIAENIEAGSSLGGLRLVLLDESGAPSTVQVTGKVSCSWHRGSKKITWQGEPIKIPSYPVSHNAPHLAKEWVRFQGSASTPTHDQAVSIECGLEIYGVAGAPAHWAVSLVDSVGALHGSGDDATNDSGVVHCNEPFALEIEALDALNNKCGNIDTGSLPEPEVTLEAEGPLDFDPEKWVKGWTTRGDDFVYAVTLSMSGHPGPVKIIIRDNGGKDEDAANRATSLLAEDSIVVDLRPGPPASLAFEGPAFLECGTSAALGNLEVSLRDSAGYRTAAKESFEAVLATGALASDGSGRAAKVVASNANKAKFIKGKSTATFKSVTVTAEAAGTYAVRAQSSSRKVALKEGVLKLSLAPQAIATAINVHIPSDMEKGCPAGSSRRLFVGITTENGEALPDEVVSSGLSLRITPPGGSRSDATVLVPMPNNDGALPKDGNLYEFLLEDVSVAGTWTAAAEYSEQRSDVRASLGKRGQLRSSTASFQVTPGPPVTLVVVTQSAQTRLLPDRQLAVTNAPSIKQRLLLKNAAVQLVDAHGNNAGNEVVSVRFRLRAADAEALKENGDGDAASSVIPDVDIAEGIDPKDVDDTGRAFFGTLSIVQGSGRVSSNSSNSSALDCQLVCEARGLYPSSAHDYELDPEGWAVCWSCPVLFSDDSAQFAAVERLNEQRNALLERRRDLDDRLTVVRDAYHAAKKQEKRAVEHVAAHLQRRMHGGDVPNTIKDAEKALKSLLKKKNSDGAVAEETENHQVINKRQPKWGPSKSPVTASIDMVLRSEDEGLIGVFAQLITIADDSLARIACAATRATLPVVVLKDADARARIGSFLSSKKYPMPDSVAMTHINPFRGPILNTNSSSNGGGMNTLLGFENASELAKSLTRAACQGTDPPLPIPLPHQRPNPHQNNNNSKKGSAAQQQKQQQELMREWPAGCLGYLCNLVRPLQKGHRPTLIYAMLSGAIIFETLKDAMAYREYVTQTLKMQCNADILTLDLGRISGRGIVSGSNFKPPMLDASDFVVGSGQSGGNHGDGDPTDVYQSRAEALEMFIELKEQENVAAAATTAAEKEMECEESNCRPELEAVEVELAKVDDELAKLQSSTSRRRASNAAAGAAGGGVRGKVSVSKRRRDDANNDDDSVENDDDNVGCEVLDHEEEGQEDDQGGKQRGGKTGRAQRRRVGK